MLELELLPLRLLGGALLFRLLGPSYCFQLRLLRGVVAGRLVGGRLGLLQRLEPFFLLALPLAAPRLLAPGLGLLGARDGVGRGLGVVVGFLLGRLRLGLREGLPRRLALGFLLRAGLGFRGVALGLLLGRGLARGFQLGVGAVVGRFVVRGLGLHRLEGGLALGLLLGPGLGLGRFAFGLLLRGGLLRGGELGVGAVVVGLLGRLVGGGGLEGGFAFRFFLRFQRFFLGLAFRGGLLGCS